jgi:hypothetical protein
MFKSFTFTKSAVLLAASLALAACSSTPDQPHIIQASPNSPQIYLTPGMATQIEMPDAARVQSLTVGNPSLVTAEQNADVVSLSAKEGAAGETNLIIRARNDAGEVRLYQYHITIQGH